LLFYRQIPLDLYSILLYLPLSILLPQELIFVILWGFRSGIIYTYLKEQRFGELLTLKIVTKSFKLVTIQVPAF